MLLIRIWNLAESCFLPVQLFSFFLFMLDGEYVGSYPFCLFFYIAAIISEINSTDLKSFTVRLFPSEGFRETVNELVESKSLTRIVASERLWIL